MKVFERVILDYFLSFAGTAFGTIYFDEIIKLAIIATVPVLVKDLLIFFYNKIKRKYFGKGNRPHKKGLNGT